MEKKQSHYVQVDDADAPAHADRNVLPEPPKLALEWSHLVLTVSVKNSQTRQMEDKAILNDVSGAARPGELLVIMGPSGAGKSTLLDCISGQNSAVEGSITVNGAKWAKGLKWFASYVMQDDLFYRTITVREHLVYQARLRMGRTSSVAQYSARVDAVLEELGLSECCDTLIGDATYRGISGGERKRLSFATEILTNPSLLFVDEPTSGLDSYMVETVLLQLQQLARDGRTAIATIHQPSSELYTFFDTLCLLSEGATVYHGKAAHAVDYFARLGYQCPGFVNPSDYFMRQLVVLSKDKDEEGVKRVQMLKDEWSKHQEQRGNSGVFFEAHSQAFDHENYQDGRLETHGQVAVISGRNVARLVRDRIAFQANVFQNLFIALIVGLIYLQLDVNQKGI